MGEAYRGFLYAAYKDKLTVEALLPDVDVHTESIAFHSQQLAEKTMKAVFVQNAVVPPKTHAVDDLLALAAEKGWIELTPEVIEAASSLTVHAVAARYTDAPDIGKGEALRAVIDANTVAAACAAAGYDAVQIESEAHLLRREADAPR